MITEDHRLDLEVPEKVPPGPVEIIIVPLPEKRKIVKLGGVLRGKEDWLEEEGDPIAEAILEERRQRRLAVLREIEEECRNNPPRKLFPDPADLIREDRETDHGKGSMPLTLMPPFDDESSG